MATVLDGKRVSQLLRQQLSQDVLQLKSRGVIPRIEAIVAAQDPSSLAFVKMKRQWAEKAGMESGSYEVQNETSTQDVLDVIQSHNKNPNVHGVLIQHPLPKHIDEERCLASLNPEKDVDGITPTSLGRLVMGIPGFRCATPLGIIKLLDHFQVNLSGKSAVVIGRSVILGKPAALMLLERNCTVTIAHSKTVDLPKLLAQSDIVVAALGKPEFVKGEWLKPGSIVIDAGYNKVDGAISDVGDCHYESCEAVASMITPVPGGVGPMTVTSLLLNTLEAAQRAHRF